MSAQPSTTALTYQGALIAERGDQLSLTDMWKAAGADPSRQPANWLASAEAKRFTEFLTDVLNPRISGNELVSTVRGGKSPGSWAHWQIGLAYAKYLSPEFHMWCNEVVRAHMERPAQAVAVPDDLMAMLKRDDGIVRMLAHKVTQIEKAVPVLVGAVEKLAGRVVDLVVSADPRGAVLDYISVRGLLDDAGAIRRGRNRLNRKIGHELRDRALTNQPPIAARRCPHSNVWLFPRDFAALYMAERGAGLVRLHNDGQRGQLQLLDGAKR